MPSPPPEHISIGRAPIFKGVEVRAAPMIPLRIRILAVIGSTPTSSSREQSKQVARALSNSDFMSSF